METNLKQFIADIHNFPNEGIVFKDISPLLKNPVAFANAIGQMHNQWFDKADVIAVLDARGFLFGGPLAYSLGLPLVMLRKKGKLPGETVGVSYDLEYGSAELEVQAGAFNPDSRVLVVDDLLATGGTAAAACNLIEKCGAVVLGCSFIAELSALNGRKLLKGREVHALVNYEE